MPREEEPTIDGEDEDHASIAQLSAELASVKAEHQDLVKVR